MEVHASLNDPRNLLFSRAARQLKRFRSLHPLSQRTDLDQCSATDHTVLKRLDLLLADRALSQGNLLLLGDDDLLSIAILAVEPHAQVTVVDLDDELLHAIRTFSSHARLRLVHADLREGLPGDLHGQFTAVLADPPYTLAGQLLFLNRALLSLRVGCISSVYLCFSRLYLSSHEIDQITGLATAAGLRPTSMIEDFNEYEAPDDVIHDMQQAGYDAPRTPFTSALVRFSGKRQPTLPAVPEGLASRIYAYGTPNATP